MTNNFYIEKQDGTRYNMKEMGVHTSSLVISSPEIRTESESFEGRNGTVEFGVTYESRTINAECTMIAHDKLDFPLKRNELYSILSSKEPYYLITEDEPGKRWLVRCENSYDIQKTNISHWGEFELVFRTTELPFARSEGTTKDIHENGIDSDDELWGFDMGLIDEMAEHEVLPATWYYVGGKKWSDF